MAGSTTARGYGWAHQRLRRALLRDAYGRLCHFCGEPMLPGQPLELDHTSDRSGYRGMAHRRCNRQDGARKGNAARQQRGSTRRNASRDW